MELTLDNKRLDILFAFCLLFTICMPALMPNARLTYFAPFLIVSCYQKSLPKCLWLALACGTIVDLFSSYTRLGLYAFDYSLSIAILYPQRRNFFADSLSTLPIMTFLFSLLSTVGMAILLYTVDFQNVFSWPWIFSDLIAMPAMDALYAFCCFILPALLLGRRRRPTKEYFF